MSETTKEQFEETYQCMSWLDEKMSAGHFSEVDTFLKEMDVEGCWNPSYLLVCCNYIRHARDRGDPLPAGPEFRTRALARMRFLVGDERAENLLKNR